MQRWYSNPLKSLSTTGNINVNGPSSAAGSDVEIYSTSSPMTIGGSVVARLGTQNLDNSYFFVNTVDAALTVMGSINVTESVTYNAYYDPPLDVETFTDGGKLTVNGSINYNLSGSSPIYSSVATHGAGDLLVKGSVNATLSDLADDEEFEMYTGAGGTVTVKGALKVSQSGTVREFFYLWTNVPNLMIGQGVTSTMSSSDHEIDGIYTEYGGNITIGGAVVQYGSSYGEIDNYIDTGFGDITIVGSVTQTAFAPGSAAFPQFPGNSNSIYTYNSDNITIGGAVTINDIGPYFHNNEIYTYCPGNITIALGVTFNDSGATEQTINEVYVQGGGNITIGSRGVTINESESASSEESYNQIVTIADSGNLTVHGLVTINAANNSSSYDTKNLVGGIGGTGVFSAPGVVIVDSGTQAQYNEVNSDFGLVNIGLAGVTITGLGSGAHYNYIQAASDIGSSVAIAGSVNVTEATTRNGNEYLEIDGNTVIGCSLVVTMNGPDAAININDYSGLGTVEVKGLFHATMLGSTPTILVGDDENANGASPVRLDSGMTLLGGFGTGATFEYDPHFVSVPFILHRFFTVVSS